MRSSYLKLSSVAAIVLLVGCSEATEPNDVSAKAEVTGERRIDNVNVGIGPVCIGEGLVSLVAEELRWHRVQTPSGGDYIDVHSSIRATITSPFTGVTYDYVSKEHLMAHTKDGHGVLQWRLSVKADPSNPDLETLVMLNTLHLTATDEHHSAEFDSFTVECN